jgi:hypothetical protein
MTTARDTYVTSIITNHATAQFGGISGLPGAPTPPGNATVWSHALAETARASGAISQSAYVQAKVALAAWEQAQASLAKAILRGTGDNAPV